MNDVDILTFKIELARDGWRLDQYLDQHNRGRKILCRGLTRKQAESLRQSFEDVYSGRTMKCPNDCDMKFVRCGTCDEIIDLVQERP